MQILSDSSPRALASQPWFLFPIEPDYGKTWQATRRRNPPCIPAVLLGGGAVFSFYCKELFLPAIHGNQVRDELATPLSQFTSSVCIPATHTPVP